MKRRAIIWLAFAVVGLMSCDEDPEQPPIEICPLNEYCGGPSERWHVLNNIEYAWKTRRVDVYEELLDNDFVFYFTPQDVSEGAPETFNRVEELLITSYMMDPNRLGPNRVRSVRLDLQFNKDELVWVEIIPPTQADEIWYTTTVYLAFTFEFEDGLVVANVPNARAQLTVRNDATGGAGRWKLVEWRDIGSKNPGAPGTQAQIEETTFGSVKELYL